MNLTPYFKSIIDQDPTQVVICDLEHTIIYMNPAACRQYQKRGGANLIGKSLLACHTPESSEKIRRVIGWFVESPSHNRIYTFRNDGENKDVYMIALRDENGALIGYYEKHEYRSRETMELYAPLRVS